MFVISKQRHHSIFGGRKNHPRAPDKRAPNKTTIPTIAPRNTLPSSKPGVSRIISGQFEAHSHSSCTDGVPGSISMSVPGLTEILSSPPSPSPSPSTRTTSDPVPSRTYRTRDASRSTFSFQDPFLLCWGHSRTPSVSHLAWDGKETPIRDVDEEIPIDRDEDDCRAATTDRRFWLAGVVANAWTPVIVVPCKLLCRRRHPMRTESR